LGYRPAKKVIKKRILHILGDMLEPNRKIWKKKNSKKKKSGNMARRKLKKKCFQPFKFLK
jgi:hypothetical protein